MKKLRLPVLLVAVFMPALATAQSGFDGTWKVELKNAQLPEKPDEFLIQDGMYRCKTCVPPIDVKADGQDQKVSGSPYFDSISVKVLDDKRIQQTTRKNGKAVGTATFALSADGNNLTVEFADSSATNSKPVTGKMEQARVSKGPAGAHAISGSWRSAKFDSMSENGLLFTYKVQGDVLSFSTPTGQSYTAKLDGTEAPMKGDPGTTSVSVKRLDKNTLEETDKREGKAIAVVRIVLAADGKSLTFAIDDKLHGTTSQFTATKQ
jgi:hypothetical protein